MPPSEAQVSTPTLPKPTANLRQDRWYVGGKAYDLSDFVERHPGGQRSIMLGKGLDCTELFHSYHVKLPVQVLNKYLDEEASNTAPPCQFSFKQDGFYETLRSRCKTYFEKHGSKAGPVWGSIYIIHMLALWVTAYNALIGGSFLAAAVYGVLRGLLIVRDTHAASHFAWSANAKLNHLVYFLSMAHSGSTPAQWHAKHVVAHHVETNMWTTDEDSMYPLKRVVEVQDPLPMHKYQHIYLWLVVYPFTTIFWALSDLTKLVHGTIAGHCIEGITPVRHDSKLAWAETYTSVLWFIFHRLVLPFIALSPLHAIAIIALSEVTGSMWFVFQFVVNHEMPDVVFTHTHGNIEQEMSKGNTSHPHYPDLLDPSEPEDWGYHQAKTSHNYGAFSRVWLEVSGGLNTQIEHHLFPSVHFRHYAHLSKIVRETCKDFSIDYNNSVNLMDALMKHHELLKYFAVHDKIGPDSKELLSEPIRPQSESRKYTWQDVAQHNAPNDCWMSIRDKVYDVTDWIQKHPGGEDMIALNGGKDATTLFEVYHDESSTAHAILKKYEIGELLSHEYPVFPSQSEFYSTLKTRVGEFFASKNADPKNRPDMILYSSLIVASVFFFQFLAVYLSVLSGWNILGCICMIGVGVFSALTCLYSVHEGSHSSLTHSPLAWRVLGATNDYVVGGSFYSWLHQHLLGHHPFTSISTHDPDIVTGDPDVRRIKDDQDVLGMHQYQHFYMPFFLYGFLAVKYRINDFIALVVTRQNGAIRQNEPTDWHIVHFWAGKFFWFLFRVYVPAQYVGWLPALVFCNIGDFVASVYLANVFQVNHVVGEAIWPKVNERNEINMDWAELQVKTTVDYAHGNKVVSFMTGHLNYQVVHHLFPNICQLWYPELAPIVKQTCAEYRIPYVIQPTFKDAWMAHFNYLKCMGKTTKKL